MVRSLVFAALAAAAGSAIAAPNAAQADKYVRDLNAVISQGALRIETMQVRKEQQAKIEELGRRAERLFGDAMAPTFGSCVGVAIYLKSSWTTQMLLAAGLGKPHQVASLAWESIQVGEKRQQCADAVDELQTPTSKSKS